MYKITSFTAWYTAWYSMVLKRQWIWGIRCTIFLQSSRMNTVQPMEEDTTLLHSIVLMYANICTIAHTTLLHFFRYDLVALTGATL